MIDPDRLRAAYQSVRDELLARRTAQGHWVGRLSTSALSTATAVSALALVVRHDRLHERSAVKDQWQQDRLTNLIRGGLRYLVAHQNDDGGWGDTDRSHSNIATSMLARAAIHLAGAADRYGQTLARAERFIDAQEGVAGLRRRYGRDKTFAVPILTNCALAGLIDWREVSPLPFEMACIPQRWYRLARLPVVSYAIPALVAIGQARHFCRPTRNPLLRAVRRRAIEPSLNVLAAMQPESGGYLEATPLTSFVLMSLAGTGRRDHPVARQALAFLVDSVLDDGSWPIDTNLATWNTTLAINALSATDEQHLAIDAVDWLLGCQHRQVHPFTGAAAGGWGWTDLSGAVPDADDTPGALLALAALLRSGRCSAETNERTEQAATLGVRWLLGMQNRDGGWPTFCRGWGKLPFDRSGADLTAHALRALSAWRRVAPTRIERAVRRGLRFLARCQRGDGSWLPLWFGNQDDPQEENPVYGTSRVLAAYRELNLLGTPQARRGVAWLAAAQHADGGFGAATGGERSVEETALAVEALAAVGEADVQVVADKGLSWLVQAVEAGRHTAASPIGFYFARLWYYEDLYPIVFTVGAFGHALAVQTADTPCPPAIAPTPST